MATKSIPAADFEQAQSDAKYTPIEMTFIQAIYRKKIVLKFRVISKRRLKLLSNQRFGLVWSAIVYSYTAPGVKTETYNLKPIPNCCEHAIPLRPYLFDLHAAI